MHYYSGYKNRCLYKMLVGAAREIRTPDPIITNDVLYQLSYCGPVEQGCARGRGSNGAALYAGLPSLGNIRAARRNRRPRLGRRGDLA